MQLSVQVMGENMAVDILLVVVDEDTDDYSMIQIMLLIIAMVTNTMSYYLLP